MSNDSATGGYLSPAASPAPLEGLALLQFIQGWIVGITGLAGNMVRPRWQPEPPNIPTMGDAWAAIGISLRKSDSYPYVKHNSAGDGSDELQRHEELDVLCSFYDMGSTGQADYYAALLRDGISIGQNREPLQKNGFGFIEVTGLVAIPSLLKQRWLYRVDLTVRLRRVIQRIYPVLDVLSEQGTLVANEADTTTITESIDVNLTPVP